jgi:pimeloyl-ACP methyl ester carboxylesterase
MKIQAIKMDRSGGIAPFSPGGGHPSAGRPITLLIHGYNNDDYEAADSFYKMRCNLDHILHYSGNASIFRKYIQSNIWEFYWPGYQPVTLLNPVARRRHWYEPVISGPSYSLEVVKARSWVADGLFNYLSRVRPSEIFFVAHSLGCRVVLETARQILESFTTPIRVTGFILMAGAVPIDLLQPTGPLGPTAGAPPRRYCLYSWRDLVLMLAFPPGQVLAGEIPLYGSPLAVGLTGQPSSLWNVRVNSKLGHHDYWSRGLFVNKERLSELCAGMLGIPVDRATPVMTLPSVPSAPPLSILPERQLYSGNLPGDDWLRDRYGSVS